jgi:hypothetical protein
MNAQPPSEEASPLVTDADIEGRVQRLIGRANIRQLWLLFLDEASVQLPLLVPIDGLPSEPTDADTAGVIDNIAEVMQSLGAASIVFVWERYGSAVLTAQDAAWARSLHDACDAKGVSLRAMLLSHRSGVRWVDEEDYVLTRARP